MNRDLISLEDLARRIDALKLWSKLVPYNWALRPSRTVFPYFCEFLPPDRAEVKFRILLLEGWQTMHDYLRLRMDPSWSFFSSPLELNHYEVVLLANGESAFFRHDTGYVPRLLTPNEKELLKKLLWEVYGMMLRMESDNDLTLKYADEKSLFSRKETKAGWVDSPFEIVPMRPHVERISYRKDVIDKAKDLPLLKDKTIALDLHILNGRATRELRPRLIYELRAVEEGSDEIFVLRHTSMDPESGLRGIWETLANVVLEAFIAKGCVPGEIKVKSKRVFRMLRPLTIELSFKLSLHNELKV
ncbi:MAG: hypothetical protein MJ109_05605 [Kiritimatiellae bacterium]|nr:hypothetical protein [Kiritimatiellia bacterium]